MICAMRLGLKFRARRLALGRTLDKLSEAAGVDVGTISALETRDSERSKYFPQLAEALGVTMEELTARPAQDDARREGGSTPAPTPPIHHDKVSLAPPSVTLDLPAECLVVWYQLERINPERRKRIRAIIAFDAACEDASALGLTPEDMGLGNSGLSKHRERPPNPKDKRSA